MKKRLSIITAVAAGATVLSATAASAVVEELPHCWTSVETGESRCFATFAEVMSDLSGGQVTVSGDASTFSAKSAAKLAALTSTVTIGIVYKNSSFTGDSNVYVSSEPCDGNNDVDFQVDLTGTGWNNSISSFEAFASCEMKLWANVYSGSSTIWTTSLSSLGGMNDAASSIEWR